MLRRHVVWVPTVGDVAAWGHLSFITGSLGLPLWGSSHDQLELLWLRPCPRWPCHPRLTLPPAIMLCRRQGLPVHVCMPCYHCPTPHSPPHTWPRVGPRESSDAGLSAWGRRFFVYMSPKPGVPSLGAPHVDSLAGDDLPCALAALSLGLLACHLSESLRVNLWVRWPHRRTLWWLFCILA